MGKKQQKRKPRITVIEGTIPPTADVEGGLTFKISRDNVTMIDSNNNEVKSKYVKVSAGYERTNKRKILNEIYGHNIGYSVNQALLEYDLLYAIDTNTISINKRIIHIAALIQVDVIHKGIKEINGKLTYIQGFMWEVDKAILNPEQHAWIFGIEFIKDKTENFSKKKIGLIVDCDLGNLQHYNDNTKPFYDDIFLPSNIKLIYASADSGSEYISNKAIKQADKVATILLSEYR